MAVTASVDGETVGCSAYSYTAHGNWDRRLSKSEKAAPRTRGQRMGREEFPAWPALQQQRREAEHKEQEAAALAATRFAPALARAVKAAEEIIADPSSTTFRTLERRRQAVCVAMEEQARRTVAARRMSADSWGYSAAEDELKRLLQLTQELFKALRAAEELLPPAEAVKAAKSRYAARIDQVATARCGSLPTSGDGAYAERRALDAARRRLERP
jgi:DNA repair exonuclease SbcCD ATPase subunit